MIYLKKASENKFFNYDGERLCYVEIQSNEIRQIPIARNDFNRSGITSLEKAVARAEQGISKIYAVSPFIGETSLSAEASLYEIEDYKTLLAAFGKGTSGHRHHIVWDYCKSDTGKGYAQITMTFKCGCVLDENNKRIIKRELGEQHGIDFTLSSEKASSNRSTTVTLDVR